MGPKDHSLKPALQHTKQETYKQMMIIMTAICNTLVQKKYNISEKLIQPLINFSDKDSFPTVLLTRVSMLHNHFYAPSTHEIIFLLKCHILVTAIFKF